MSPAWEAGARDRRHKKGCRSTPRPLPPLAVHGKNARRLRRLRCRHGGCPSRRQSAPKPKQRRKKKRPGIPQHSSRAEGRWRSYHTSSEGPSGGRAPRTKHRGRLAERMGRRWLSVRRARECTSSPTALRRHPRRTARRGRRQSGRVGGRDKWCGRWRKGTPALAHSESGFPVRLLAGAASCARFTLQGDAQPGSYRQQSHVFLQILFDHQSTCEKASDIFRRPTRRNYPFIVSWQSDDTVPSYSVQTFCAVAATWSAGNTQGWASFSGSTRDDGGLPAYDARGVRPARTGNPAFEARRAAWLCELTSPSALRTSPSTRHAWWQRARQL